MVLSPIEPVAPSTLTVRTADAAALLLRNGTALIFSPNHKTAADAIHATPQNAENRRHDDRRDVSVETVQQAAMARNDVAGVLDAEAAFHCGFKQIAELGRNRQNRPQKHQRTGFAETKRRKAQGDQQARRKAADRASPGLLRTDA